MPSIVPNVAPNCICENRQGSDQQATENDVGLKWMFFIQTKLTGNKKGKR
jgi:hypothetical protein